MATYSLDDVISKLAKTGVKVEFRKLDIWLYHDGKLLRTFTIKYLNGNQALIDARDFDNWLFYMGFT